MSKSHSNLELKTPPSPSQYFTQPDTLNENQSYNTQPQATETIMTTLLSTKNGGHFKNNVKASYENSS